jgi:hypothetical protein
MRTLPLLFLLAAPAFAAQAKTKSVPSAPVVVKRIADAASWKKLKARAAARPSMSQKIAVNGANYTVFSVVSNEAYPQQDCPAGSQPRSAVHFTVPAPAPEDGIYPVRLTVACIAASDSSPRDLISVDADADGNILDITTYDASLNLTLHPTAEPVPVAGDTQTSNLLTVLTRVVKHLTDAP